MPTMPTYEPQVDAKTLPGFREDSVATPSLLSGQADSIAAVSKGASALGANVSAIAAQAQERTDITQVLNVEAARKEKMIAADVDMRKNRTGVNAEGATGDAKTWWDNAAREDMEVLQNDTQRELYKRRLGATRVEGIRSAASWEAQQGHAAFVQSGDASIQAAQNSASADPSPSNVAIQSDAIRQVVAARAMREGWSPSQNGKPSVQDVVLKDKLTNLHSAVIANMVDQNPDGARAYFDEHKDEINGTRYDELNKLLKHGGDKVTAQDFTEKVFTEGLSEADALARARKELKGDAEDLAVQHIKVRYGEAARQREAGQKDAADSGWQAFSKRGSLSDIPAPVWNAMDGRDKTAMREAARRLEKRGEEKMPKTDWNTYYDLRQQALADPTTFAQRDLRREFDKLAPAQREQLIDLQSKKPAQMHEVVSLEAQLSNTHDLLKWGGTDREKKGKFDSAVTAAVNAQQKAQNKPLNFDERQKIIDRVLVEGDTNGWVPFGNKRVFEMTPQEKASMQVIVPPAEKAAITDAFKRKNGGKEPTADDIINLYKLKMGL